MLKIISNLLVILFAVPAFSCPELQGNFDCAANDNSGPVNSFTISKGTEGGQVIYQINGTKLIANGIPQTRNNGDSFPTTYTTSCENQSLKARIQTQVSSAICPSLPLAVDSITVFTLQGSDIEMNDQTILSCPDKSPINIRHIYTCKLK